MVRQFTLINSNGDVWNLMSKSSFFHAPGGLGFTKSIETETAGFEFIELRDDLDQKVVSGEMVFADYSVYRDFAKFISHEPLKLGYKPYSTTWYYLDVKVSSLQKTEIDRTTGLLLCPVDFLAFTTWYTIDRYENVIPVPPPVVNLMVQGLSATIEEDWKIVANSDTDFVYRALVGTVAPDTNTVPVDLPSFAGDVYDLTAGDYYFKAIGKRQNVKSYFQTLPLTDEAEGNPVEIARAVEVAPNSLEVSVSPTQDATPWISSTVDTDPYTFRVMPSGASGGNREYDKLVGGSVVWNQLAPTLTSADYTLGVATISDGVAIGTQTGQGFIVGCPLYFTGDHKYLAKVEVKLTSATDQVYLRANGANQEATTASTSWQTVECIFTAVNTGTAIGVYDDRTSDWDSVEAKNFQLFDLTAMFGTSVANSMTAELFRSYFPKSYYAYSSPTIQSVSVSEKVTTGVNQWDEEWEVGGINTSTGADQPSSNSIRSKNFIRLDRSLNYYISVPSSVFNNNQMFIYFYDENKSFVSASLFNAANGWAERLLKPTRQPIGVFIRIVVGYGTTYNHDICINISDPTINGNYYAYTSNTYSLSTTELRGIPSLVDGQLVYDGDEYSSSGSVVRKYAKKTIANLTLSMSYAGIFTVTNSDRAYGQGKFNVLADGYVTYTGEHSKASNIQALVQANGNGIYCNSGSNTFFIADSAYTSVSDFVTAKGTSALVYELATATTETADPFTNPQVIDEHGTESYTDYPVSQGTRDVAIPVGHKSNYALSVPVVGKDSVAVNVSGSKNLFGHISTAITVSGVTYTWNADGTLTANGTSSGETGANNSAWKNNGYVTLLKGTYKVVRNNPTVDTGKSQNGWYLYDYDSGERITAITNTVQTFTLTEDTKVYLSCYQYNAGYTNASVEILVCHDTETGTNYTPFVGNTTYTHTLSPTMFGGQVEMVSGVETTEMAEVDLSTLSWNYSANRNGYFYTQLPSMKPNGTLYCTAYPFIGIRPSSYTTDKVLALESTSDTYIDVHDTSYTNANDFSASLNGVKLVYQLATPTTSQGAVSAVSLLKGDNVLSTDGDELAVNFKQYPDDRLVLDKFGELESDPDSAVDSQAVSNFTVYDPARVQFYMDYEAIPYDYDVKAELVSGSYSNEKIYSYPYPYTYGAGVNGEIHVTNDGTVPAYCKLTIVGEVEDPTWSVYQNGNLIERGRVTATIVSGHKLVMNSQPRALELSEYSIDGTYIANLYGVSDFSTKRFITIPVGESTITVTHTGETPFDMYLEVYPLAKTI